MDLSIIPYDDRTQQHLVNSQLPDWLPKHEFLMLIVAPAGSGKTTLLLNMLLRIYKQYWHQIFLFSPTIHNDGKWEHLKKEKQLLLTPVKKGLHEQYVTGQGIQGSGGGGGGHQGDNNEKENERLPQWMKETGKNTKKQNDEVYTYPETYGGSSSKKTLSKKSIFSKKHGPPVIHKRPHQKEMEEMKRLRQNQEVNIDTIKKKYLEYQERRETLLTQLQKPLTPMELQLWEDLKDKLFKTRKKGIMDQGNEEQQRLKEEEEQQKKEGKDRSKKAKKLRMVSEHEMFEEYNEETLQSIMEQKDELVKQTKQQSHSKDGLKWMTEVERSVFVFDDMVGSGLFSNKRQNAFKRLTVRRRHLFSSVIGVTQAYREIPKTTRTNANAIILFHIDNEEELNTIYEEFPMGLKWHQWMAVVEWATSEPYSFIMFNTQQSDPNQRIVKQFIQPLPLDWIKQTFI